MSSASNVWFIPVKDSSDTDGAALQLNKLLEQSGFPSMVSKGMGTHIKLHFGENGTINLY